MSTVKHINIPNPVWRWIRFHPQLIIYTCLVLVVVLVLALDQYNQNADEKDRCVSGIDSRNVDRDQTQRIYDLALSFVPKDLSTLPPSEREQTKSYIKTVENFRTDSFAAIQPSEACLPYVDDDHVTPQDWVKEHPPKLVN